MVKVGALWIKDTKKGQKMMSGEISGQKVMIFKNGFKKASKHPDYVVYDGSRDADDAEPKADAKKTATKAKAKGKEKPADDAANDDDIPF